jgi:hypothetical protein
VRRSVNSARWQVGDRVVIGEVADRLFRLLAFRDIMEAPDARRSHPTRWGVTGVQRHMHP